MTPAAVAFLLFLHGDKDKRQPQFGISQVYWRFVLRDFHYRNSNYDHEHSEQGKSWDHTLEHSYIDRHKLILPSDECVWRTTVDTQVLPSLCGGTFVSESLI